MKAKPEKNLSVYQQRLDILWSALVKTKATKGRKNITDEDEPYYSISPWSLDRIKISRSHALARASGKTQVYPVALYPYNFPLNPHIRNRMIHINEVAAIAAIVAETLQLDPNLTDAIAKGHDLGQPPFGHNGAKALDINHAHNGGVIAQEVEREGRGLNLTYEVIQGIIEHSRDSSNLAGARLPNETKVVIHSDEIAYTVADWEDLLRVIEFYKNNPAKKKICLTGNEKSASGLKELLGNGLEKDLPEIMDDLGKNNGQRILSCINALVKESLEKNQVSFLESSVAKDLREIRSWMYKRIYHNLDQTEERRGQRDDLKMIVEYVEKKGLSENLDARFAVSLLTDREAEWLAKILNDHNPSEEDVQMIETLSMREIVRSLNGKEINHTKSPLW